MGCVMKHIGLLFFFIVSPLQALETQKNNRRFIENALHCIDWQISCDYYSPYAWHSFSVLKNFHTQQPVQLKTRYKQALLSIQENVSVLNKSLTNLEQQNQLLIHKNNKLHKQLNRQTWWHYFLYTSVFTFGIIMHKECLLGRYY